MKKQLIIFISLLAISIQTFADVVVTKPRHLNIVLSAIAQECALDKFDVVEVATQVRHDKIDQGIVDIYYQSQFKVFSREDGRHDEVYMININSTYSDAYDHDAKDWGIYYVTDVGNCSRIE